jgi:hypothetical protein
MLCIELEHIVEASQVIFNGRNESFFRIGLEPKCSAAAATYGQIPAWISDLHPAILFSPATPGNTFCGPDTDISCPTALSIP